LKNTLTKILKKLILKENNCVFCIRVGYGGGYGGVGLEVLGGIGKGGFVEFGKGGFGDEGYGGIGPESLCGLGKKGFGSGGL